MGLTSEVAASCFRFVRPDSRGAFALAFTASLVAEVGGAEGRMDVWIVEVGWH